MNVLVWSCSTHITWMAHACTLDPAESRAFRTQRYPQPHTASRAAGVGVARHHAQLTSFTLVALPDDLLDKLRSQNDSHIQLQRCGCLRGFPALVSDCLCMPNHHVSLSRHIQPTATMQHRCDRILRCQSSARLHLPSRSGQASGGLQPWAGHAVPAARCGP